MVVRIPEMLKLLRIAKSSNNEKINCLETKSAQLKISNRVIAVSLFVFLNGEGKASGSYLSIFIRALPIRSINLIVTICLKNYVCNQSNFKKSFLVDGESFENVVGIREFIRHEELISYLQHGKIEIGMKLDPH